MSCFNAQRWVAQAVESVLSQTFTAFELIVIDDGSSDATRAIVEDFVRSDQRVRLVPLAHVGLVRALNRGLELSRAPFIARMDADDLCRPTRLEHQMALMRSNPEIAAVGSSIQRIDAAGRPLDVLTRTGRELDDPTSVKVPIFHPTALIRRTALDLVGRYRAAFTAAEDLDLWMRFVDSGMKIANVEEVLLDYRWHGGNVSTTDNHVTGSVARALLSRGMRRAGLPDPFDSDQHSLSDGSIAWERFPLEVRGPVRLYVAQKLIAKRGAPAVQDDSYEAIDGALADLGHIRDLYRATEVLTVAALVEKRPLLALTWLAHGLRCDAGASIRGILNLLRAGILRRSPTHKLFRSSKHVGLGTE